MPRFRRWVQDVKKCYVEKRISKKCWELPFGALEARRCLPGSDPGNRSWAWMSGTVGGPGAACALPFFLFLQNAFRSAVEAQHAHHVCCLRGSKNTFYWEEMICQYLDGGFRMSKKGYCIYRISKNKWEVSFGGSRSQIVFSRVGPQEPGKGLNVRDCRCACCCICTLFLRFEKILQERCRSTTFALRMLPTVCDFGSASFFKWGNFQKIGYLTEPTCLELN